jgi:hypothetical protein
MVVFMSIQIGNGFARDHLWRRIPRLLTESAFVCLMILSVQLKAAAESAEQESTASCRTKNPRAGKAKEAE